MVKEPNGEVDALAASVPLAVPVPSTSEGVTLAVAFARPEAVGG
jgi:hypothetical protein